MLICGYPQHTSTEFYISDLILNNLARWAVLSPFTDNEVESQGN